MYLDLNKNMILDVRTQILRDFLDSPARVIIEFTPDYKLSYDGDLMWARSPELIRSKDERAARTATPKND